MTRGYSRFIGRRFNDLVVIRRDFSKKRIYFYCKCSCGKMKSVYGYHLKRRVIKSCGCKSMKAFGKNNPTYTGYEDISGVYWAKIREGAKNRKLRFDISIKYVWNLFLTQKRRCALSGVPLKFNSGFRVRNGNASLDRIDSTKGYIRGNVQWVHKIVNKLKTNLTDDEVIKWATIIAEFQS